jgi:FAD-dependent urate hydroxylase
MTDKLLIAGGGIGGLSTAIALKEAGLDFELFEQAGTFGEVGAGMSLWPNATRVLQAWGVLKPLLALGEQVSCFNLFRSDGRLISAIPVEGFSTPALCIHRADLHRCLRDALPPGLLHTDCRLVSYEEGRDRVMLRFLDGREVAANGLVGADGVNSVVRTQLHGDAPPTYRGYCIWRGIAPDFKGRIGGHISETWGAGQRFGILPMGQGRICWYATKNGPPSLPDAPEGRKAEVLSLFKDWHHPVPELLRKTDPAAIMKNNARDRPALRSWGTGRVTLLGDAAHPITPNLGQGACLAVEDAACLAKALAAARNVQEAFRSYEKIRRRRTSFVALRSRRIGSIAQWDNRWIIPARNLVARLVLACEADLSRNPVYEYEA